MDDSAAELRKATLYAVFSVCCLLITAVYCGFWATTQGILSATKGAQPQPQLRAGSVSSTAAETCSKDLLAACGWLDLPW